jgi:branched-chain amino acid transport system ATP-binding protein
LSPELILLDEPSAGIAHSEIPALAKWIRALSEDLHMTVLVVDHDMNLLRSVCDEFVAMHLGQVIARGTADEVAADPKVIEAFLGTRVAAVERSPAATVVE